MRGTREIDVSYEDCGPVYMCAGAVSPRLFGRSKLRYVCGFYIYPQGCPASQAGSGAERKPSHVLFSFSASTPYLISMLTVCALLD